MTRKVKVRLHLFLGIIISLVALWFAFRKISLDDLLKIISNVKWAWIFIAAFSKLIVLFIKSFRWRRELKAMDGRVYRHSFQALSLGYFSNTILPFKLGELIRVGLLKRYNPSLNFGHGLATIAAERSLDGSILAILVLCMIPFVPMPSWIVVGTSVLLIAMLLIIALANITTLHKLMIKKLPTKGLGLLLRKVIESLSKGTAVLRQGRDFTIVVILTIMAWLIEALVFWSVVQSLALPLSYPVCFISTVLISVAILIPSAPGQIGTHQALSVFILGGFGIATIDAVSLSIVLQVVSLSVLGTLGGLVLLRETQAREVLREVRSEESI